jgi:hypothetical protein
VCDQMSSLCMSGAPSLHFAWVYVWCSFIALVHGVTRYAVCFAVLCRAVLCCAVLCPLQVLKVNNYQVQEGGQSAWDETTGQQSCLLQTCSGCPHAQACQLTGSLPVHQLVLNTPAPCSPQLAGCVGVVPKMVHWLMSVFWAPFWVARLWRPIPVTVTVLCRQA